MKLDRRALLLLVIQIALVSTIAAKYLYQRNTCPRVWTRAVAFDPEMILRGRYLSAQIYVDTCGLTMPEHSLNPFPNLKETPNAFSSVYFNQNGTFTQRLASHITAHNGHLIADSLVPANTPAGQYIQMRGSFNCAAAFLEEPVDFYLPSNAQSPFPLPQGAELWIEVTVPPKGPPRPLNLAISNNGHWQPLNY